MKKIIVILVLAFSSLYSSYGYAQGFVTATPVLCFGAANGCVHIDTNYIFSGPAPYQYSLSSTSNIYPINNGKYCGLTAGAYSVIVKDANNAQTTIPINVFQPRLFQ